ncbi:MAG: Putative methyltransferase associated with DUF414 [uncultured Campylobacterales bacterium]|uniref:Methyltransferase associated with DUF414 n=1 Tax=uncultured Campylobacterales bacterium TaxID=352960 RepID=A0A6S6S127_9BACT|nr:MAG: Putative methyltransferase associated with DUF414 [uncultured Campylobacterales bacterium]
MNECKICENKTRELKDIKKSLTYFRCNSCGFTSLDEKNIVDKNTEKKHYEKHENSFEDLGYVKMFEDFVDVAVKPLGAIQTALEFGCGFAPVLCSLLEKRGITVHKYDYYFHPVKIYENKKYDLITSTEVFEHLKDPLITFDLLTKCLSEDGYLVLMTKFTLNNDQEFLKWWYRRDITHISFFTPKSFEVIASKFGLKVLKTINENIVVFKKL